MSLIRMTHPSLGELLVPDRKAAAYEERGWRRRRKRQPKNDQQAPEASPGASSLPEHKEES